LYKIRYGGVIERWSLSRSNPSRYNNFDGQVRMRDIETIEVMYLPFGMKCGFYRHRCALDGTLMRDCYIRCSIDVELTIDYTSLRRYGVGESKLAVETLIWDGNNPIFVGLDP